MRNPSVGEPESSRRILFCPTGWSCWGIYGVSKGDVVATRHDDGELRAVAVVQRGGHSTLRVFAEASDFRQSILQRLSELGASCGITKGLSLFTADIPPEVDFAAIDAYLDSISDGEDIAYEDACLQHNGVGDDRRRECEAMATVPLRLH
ncbi:DUF4265 domain-containing protein [Bordetella genomosp. 13]|nr:DUF4265 domain-containing protein [Bordetella genomosp. 13]